MKSLIKPLFYIAFSAAVVACGESVETQLARAQAAYDDGRIKDAVIDLKTVLQEQPNSVQARQLLGMASLHVEDYLSAEKELDRAMRLGADPAEVVPQLAHVYLVLNKHKELYEFNGEELEGTAKAALLANQGLAYLSEGKRRKANRHIARALEADAQSADAKFAKATLLVAEGDIEQALALVESVVAADANNDRAWVLLADIQVHKDMQQAAVTSYGKAVDIAPQKLAARYKRAFLAMQLQSYELAQEDVSVLLKRSPQHPGANYIRGLLEFKDKNIEQAISALSVAEPMARDIPAIAYFLASSHFQQGNLDQAAVYASQFHNRLPDNVAGRLLLAVVRLQQSDFKEVEELVAPVVDKYPDNVEALNILANAQLAQGKVDEGVSALERVAELQPDSAPAQVRLGAGLMLGGEAASAQEHIQSAIELDPKFQQADILLVLQHVREGDFSAALAAAEDYRSRNLGDVTPLNLIARVYLEADQTDEARKAFLKVLQLEPHDPTANHQVAALELADGNTSAASERYQAVLEQDEDHLPSLMQLASIAAAENREADMLARLEQAAEAHPQALPPRLTLARYYLQKSRPEQVAPLFTTLEKATRERPEVLHLLASAQLASRDTKAADNTLEDLLEASPESAQTHHMMALSALSQGDPEQAKGYWQKVLELDPQFLGAHLGLARIALATDDTAALERHLEILRTQAPDQPEVLMLRAAAASAAGEKGSALALASAAHSQVNSSKTLLAQAHYMRLAGDLPGALALRAGWLEQHPKDLAVRLSYADGLLAGGEEKPAIEHYETVLAASPNQVIALNNLAWLLRDAQPERSLELVRRAATLAPESAEVLDTLAVVEFEQERYRQAMRSIERALAIKPDNPSLRFHHAMILEASGEPGAAKDILTQLLTQEQAFPELAEAEALLQKLQ